MIQSPKNKFDQQAIGEGLRRMFEEVASEPTPDEFLDILRRFEDAAQDSDGEVKQ
jgi:hypothetical protein